MAEYPSEFQLALDLTGSTGKLNTQKIHSITGVQRDLVIYTNSNLCM